MTGNQEEGRNRESNFAPVLRGRFSGDTFSAVKLLADKKWHLHHGRISQANRSQLETLQVKGVVTKDSYLLFDTACVIKIMHCIQLHYLVYQGDKILAHAANDSESSCCGWQIYWYLNHLRFTGTDWESLTAFQDILKISSPRPLKLLWKLTLPVCCDIVQILFNSPNMIKSPFTSSAASTSQTMCAKTQQKQPSVMSDRKRLPGH